MAIFNLEVVYALEVVKSSPSHAGLGNGKSDGTQNNILIKHPRTKKHREIKKHRRRSAKTRRKIESKPKHKKILFKPYLRTKNKEKEESFDKTKTRENIG